MFMKSASAYGQGPQVGLVHSEPPLYSNLVVSNIRGLEACIVERSDFDFWSTFWKFAFAPM